MREPRKKRKKEKEKIGTAHVFSLNSSGFPTPPTSETFHPPSLLSWPETEFETGELEKTMHGDEDGNAQHHPPSETCLFKIDQ